MLCPQTDSWYQTWKKFPNDSRMFGASYGESDQYRWFWREIRGTKKYRNCPLRLQSRKQLFRKRSTLPPDSC